MRKDRIQTDQVYHVFTRSIAGFVVFRNNSEYERLEQLLSYYQYKDLDVKFSRYISLKNSKTNLSDSENSKIVQIISYCIMPTHIHLVLKQLEDEGISGYMQNILNSYTRFFNIKNKRKGPLWESRFKNVLVESDEQLLHLTRYLHLNPTSAELVDKPEEWNYSSYREFIDEVTNDRLTKFNELIDINPTTYKKFVNSRLDYQKELSKIKSLLLD